MSKITGKVNYKEVLKGDTGYTFEPHVTVDGILYWTNNGNLENPLPVNLHGKQGFMFIPHVDSEGNLSWTNTGELENPPTVNIKGNKGYFYTPHISEDGILTWSNNGNLENPQPFNISDLILNEVKESRIDTTGKTFSKLKERLDSDFKKLSESIKNNDTKDEVVQARTATTGENFMTLDDRIDHEVMRLREKIEVTMLEQENKESHDISNTIEGMTTDMVVKGRTLQNLVTDGNRTNVIDNSINTNNRIHNFKVSYNLQIGKKYVGYLKIDNIENAKYGLRIYGLGFGASGAYYTIGDKAGVYKFTWNTSTAPETITEFHTIGIYIDNEDFVNGCKATFSDFMLFEEGTDLTYIDEYFEGIKSFGQQEDKISILSSGKNLLKKELDTVGQEITIPKIGDYTFSFDSVIEGGRCGVYIIYEGKTLVSKAFNNGRVNLTLNIQQTEGLIVKVGAWDSGSKVVSINNSMMVEGVEATSYEPYKSDKKDILLQDLGFDEGLKGINSISDEINYIRKVAIKRIGKREYKEGDELLENIITDKTNTYYVLEEPIETPLNENINVKTFNNKTYVNFENSIKGVSSFKVPVNTNKLINDLKFEKEELKEKFNNLTNEFENFKTLMIQTLPYKEV